MVAIEALSLSPLTAAAVVIFLSLVYYFLKNRNVLPGPRGLPYFGIYPFLDNDCYLQLQEIGKKYGDVFSFTIAGRLFINLGSVKVMRDLHVSKADCFAERPASFSLLHEYFKDGILWSPSEPWKTSRKFFIRAFKEYGLTFMKEFTAGPLYDSLALTLDDIRAHKGDSFKVLDLLATRCTGTMRRVVFGMGGVSDEKTLKISQTFMRMMDGYIAKKLSLVVGPFARFQSLTNPILKRSQKQHKILTDLLMETIIKIESSFDENNPTCVVEEYFKERNIRKQKNDPTWKHLSDQALIESLSQIVGDGIFAVAYFIGCFLQALTDHPEEQDKLYNELMDVVGKSRLPTIEDKSKLPYTGAFMNEVNRTSNLFPIFPSLECTRETTIRGYRIPKGSITMQNFWQAHHDPQTYENPDSFNPSRFLASPGKPRAELPATFGLGKHSCTGEPYVLLISYLFLTSIVKTFTITAPPDSKKSTVSLLTTGELELCFKPRSEK